MSAGSVVVRKYGTNYEKVYTPEEFLKDIELIILYGYTTEFRKNSKRLGKRITHKGWHYEQASESLHGVKYLAEDDALWKYAENNGIEIVYSHQIGVKDCVIK